ncbi:glucan biosynthesis protein [Arenimonas sp. MALMAid1274]|uniref:glucan biosynthesis protein n=1 Tax=Arenimonas sp. MALMAid1274 TaxID=3411630 RepID=UPI003BA2CC91
MHRRDLLKFASLFPLLAASGVSGAAEPFDAQAVVAKARALAASPFRAPEGQLPASLRGIGYDQYRDIRFRPAKALWRGQGLPFQAQFFHRGYLFMDRVDLSVVQGGQAWPIAYDPALFEFGPQPVPSGDLGFAGFRLHAPINVAGRFDEVCAFLGASYFRAVGRDQRYGLSARGLALASGEQHPEEFPVFRAFWIEQPAAGATALVVHALMDGPSAAAAFRFEIHPGADTRFDTRMHLFPRVDLDRAGIAPLTSMFHFTDGDGQHVDDFRPAAHDSDGLALHTGRGEQAWRPLRNPPRVRLSHFQDTSPRGFGLMQRKRDFADFADLEAGYEHRPSLWVEPVGDWGPGAVVLVEIPTGHEYQDNIVAFWRPAQPLAAGREHSFEYRLHWGPPKAWQDRLATVADTRVGAGTQPGLRRFVVDFQGAALDGADKLQALVETSRGQVLRPQAQANPETGGWRISFEFAPEAGADAELRALLRDGRETRSETWLYRWAA